MACGTVVGSVGGRAFSEYPVRGADEARRGRQLQMEGLFSASHTCDHGRWHFFAMDEGVGSREQLAWTENSPLCGAGSATDRIVGNDVDTPDPSDAMGSEES